MPPSLRASSAPGAAEALQRELAGSGDLQSRLRRDDADLVVFYGAEHRGSLEPCGCPAERRGSVPRLATWVEASCTANPDTPWVLVHGGYWLEDAIGAGGVLRGDVPVRNDWMAQAFAAMPWTAINVAYSDLPGLAELGERASGLPLVSANVRARDTEAPQVVPWISAEAGGLRIGITGITSPEIGFIPTPGYQLLPPLEAAQEQLTAHAGEVDVVILLAYKAIDTARDLAEQNPELDLVIDAWQHRELITPFRVGESLWVRSYYETQRLGELRLWLQEGDIYAALDRKVELDPDIPSGPPLLDMMIHARQAIEAKEREVFGF